MIELSNKVALVTGCASADGLGFASARKLASLGASVLLTDIVEAEVEARAAELRERGYRAQARAHDISDETAWDEVMQAVVDEFGRLDILVNNAGYALHQPIDVTSAAEWRQQIEVNLSGTFLGVKAAMAQMRAQGDGGSIVNIASISALIGAPNLTAYSASKGGIRLLTKAAAMECAAEQIRINNVCPGFIETDIVKRAQAASPERFRETVLNTGVPLGGFGQPDDIACAVSFLASDSAKYITAIDLAVDGGVTAK